MPANEERSISLGQLQERPMKEPTSDTEGRYGDGAARTKVRRPKPKALLYHVCSNRIELLFQNGEHKVALVRSAIKQVAKRFLTSLEKKLSCRHQGKGLKFYTTIEAESKGLVERRFRLSGGRKASQVLRFESPRSSAYAPKKEESYTYYGTGLKASLMSYLTKLKEFQFPKQPSPKQQLEPIQLMKEDLPSRKGLKAS
ncbi:hypothetical protein Tco_1093320 [Tanacetum coccineum]|uniref:Uncharacterized protein n=1 Tax=Tanacetum coccineum TaxID=301880 RepID=A0ABQ5ICC4_9ASTR